MNKSGHKQTQRDVFLQGEGDQWFERNTQSLGTDADKQKHDPVLALISNKNLLFKNVLEIGASNGWRLSALRAHNDRALLCGIDPSAQAVANAAEGVELKVGTAENLDYNDRQFDLVIFGFCLYLCDRADLFKIAAEADRVLADQGHMIVYDFYASTPYKNSYGHKDGMFSYKMNYADLFTWNPAYKIIDEIVQPHPGAEDKPDNQIGVHLLQKNLKAAYPDNPYKS